jgi:hypothetical protein
MGSVTDENCRSICRRAQEILGDIPEDFIARDACSAGYGAEISGLILATPKINRRRIQHGVSAILGYAGDNGPIQIDRGALDTCAALD